MISRVYGIDFSSAPTPRKPITIAIGELAGTEYQLQQVVEVGDWSQFDDFLNHPGPWLAGFDLPFSLPRALIEHYRWPTQWPVFIRWYGQQPRAELRLAFKMFCDARPWVTSLCTARQIGRPDQAPQCDGRTRRLPGCYMRALREYCRRASICRGLWRE